MLLLLSILPACRERGEAASPVLLRIDSRTLTVEQFKNEFGKVQPEGETLPPDELAELKKSFLVQLIDRELTLAEAERKGIKVSPEELSATLEDYRKEYPEGDFEKMLTDRGLTLAEWKQELEQGLIMEKLLRQEVYTAISVTDEEIAAYYKENAADFDRPEQVRARQIVLGTEEEGRRILGRLRQGESFEELARAHSLSPEGAEGGDLGYFSRGDMPPELEAAAFSMPKGKMSDLIKTEYGFHILLVEDHRKAQKLGLAEVSEEIREELVSRKEELAYQNWLQDLRAKATIEMDWSKL